MRTQVISQAHRGVAFLESGSGGGEDSHVTLDALPLVIGRDPSADLRIESTRISREHAVITVDADGFRIRDLGSTNGTFVNGARIEDTRLASGDIILIADEEFTFCCPGVDVDRSTATQVIDGSETIGALPLEPGEVVRQIRCLQEILSRKAVQTRFDRVVDLASSELLGFEAHTDTSLLSSALDLGLLAALEGPLADRWHHLCRQAACEDLPPQDGPKQLMLEIHASEFGGQAIADSFARLAGAICSATTLVAAVPESATHSGSYLSELASGFAELGVRLACRTTGSHLEQLLDRCDPAPAFVKLDASLLLGEHRNPKRHEFAEDFMRTARHRGVPVIAEGLRRPEDAQRCRDLGCRYGQGSLYSHDEGRLTDTR